jgi:hypothetical protein
VHRAVIKPADGDARTLLWAFNANAGARADLDGAGQPAPFFEVDGKLALTPLDNPARAKVLWEKYAARGGAKERTDVTAPTPSASPVSADAAARSRVADVLRQHDGYREDDASIILEEHGQRFRLPRGTVPTPQFARGKREVVTERFLLHAGNTFYELPRDLAGGARRVRPICTTDAEIADFCSWRGLLVLAGEASQNGPAGFDPATHLLRVREGAGPALWLGEVDDLWKFGAPRGVGGPWKESHVKANAPSDPYLMTGYDRKSLEITHGAAEPVTFTVEVDFLADGSFSKYASFTVEPGKPFKHEFPEGYSAHWVRLTSDRAATVTATFRYD